jgi:hypothetical protein
MYEMKILPTLSKGIFYSANKNGRFGIRLLTERYQVCKFNTITRFYKETKEQEILLNGSLEKKEGRDQWKEERKGHGFSIEMKQDHLRTK